MLVICKFGICEISSILKFGNLKELLLLFFHSNTFEFEFKPVQNLKHKNIQSPNPNSKIDETIETINPMSEIRLKAFMDRINKKKLCLAWEV